MLVLVAINLDSWEVEGTNLVEVLVPFDMGSLDTHMVAVAHPAALLDSSVVRLRRCLTSLELWWNSELMHLRFFLPEAPFLEEEGVELWDASLLDSSLVVEELPQLFV